MQKRNSVKLAGESIKIAILDQSIPWKKQKKAIKRLLREAKVLMREVDKSHGSTMEQAGDSGMNSLKTNLIAFRADDAHLQKLRHVCETCDMNQSEVLRALIDQAPDAF
jgi:hypothetical protein